MTAAMVASSFVLFVLLVRCRSVLRLVDLVLGLRIVSRLMGHLLRSVHHRHLLLLLLLVLCGVHAAGLLHSQRLHLLLHESGVDVRLVLIAAALEPWRRGRGARQLLHGRRRAGRRR